MPEGRFLLMTSLDGRRWRAAEWPPLGRVFTRREAEGLAAQTHDGPRFLLALEAADEDLARGEALVMGADETLWDYGEPLGQDLRAVLRAAAAAPSPEPLPAPGEGRLPVRIATVRQLAERWFGSAGFHVLELPFDELVFDVGGQRDEGEPAVYLVPCSALQPG